MTIHCLPAAELHFKYLTLAYWTATGSAPAYLNAMIQLYSPSRPLCSSDERLLSLPSLCSKRCLLSRLYWLILPQFWHDIAITLHYSDSFGTFKKLFKTQIFKHYMYNKFLLKHINIYRYNSFGICYLLFCIILLLSICNNYYPFSFSISESDLMVWGYYKICWFIDIGHMLCAAIFHHMDMGCMQR